MSYHHSYLFSAGSILLKYKGQEPFAYFIKKYFAANKKYGSRDRKQITSLCYNYFRLGSAVLNILIEQRILLGTFLCEYKRSRFLENIKPEWNDLADKPLQDKLALIYSHLSVENIFQYQDELSQEIDAEKFNQSFLIQPDLLTQKLN